MNEIELLTAKCKAYHESFEILNNWRNENLHFEKKVKRIETQLDENNKYLDILKKEFDRDNKEAKANKAIVKRLTDKITELKQMQLKPEAEAQKKLILTELEEVLIGEFKKESQQQQQSKQ